MHKKSNLQFTFSTVSLACHLNSILTRSQKAWLEGKLFIRKSCVTPLSKHPHSSNPDVLASPPAGGFICQQYTRATYSSYLFSPLADVSTSSGMHSSCPSFAHVTNVCLAVCKIRSSSFFFFSAFGSFSFFFPLSLKKETSQQTQDRKQRRALCFLV